MALKEWSVVCEALRSGRQSVLVRKGGIHEGPGGFQPEHNRFWLFPTRFHQAAEELQELARDLLTKAESVSPPAGRVHLTLQAEVQRVFWISREEQLTALEGLQILSEEILRQRFHYRRPGVYVLAVKVWERSEVLDLPELPEYAGCHSWVPLDQIPEQEEGPLIPVAGPDHLDLLRERLSC